ncbi:interleukin-15 receptor subunit alpha isoform X2 [Halichoerus grypus]|uniref:interleukin-15 receptor subunit alpha isoform X2 n=1 Tax=Phoca vitulina TaxID=9720 RepID=UPI001395E9A9|nr:interleukin-15 receptor subunit alpha isoform X2 [Phoca vitulina]XP_035945955.1 interleukin-15 receptor subunit alpha isoform X2 [Halichoerus grypus]
MAGRRRSGCRVSALPALLSLLQLLLTLGPATPGITCPPPTSVEHADIRVKSYNLSSRERYTCNSGFKRKAGTSSLTECVFNKTMNVAHWTIPNLKCIRDPSLTHLRPSSTEVPAGVTPEPQSTSLSGKEPAFTSTSDTTVATKPDIVPGSRPMPSKPPATGTTGPISQEPSQAPPQTTAKALERTPSASQETPGTYSYNSGAVTVCLDIMEEEAKGMSLSLDSKCSVTSLAQGPPLSLELGVCRRDSHSEETGRGIMKAKLQLTSTGLFQ